MDQSADDRLTHIESEFRESATKIDAISTQIDNLLRALGTGHAPQPHDLPPPPNSTEDDEEFVLPPTGPRAFPDSESAGQVSDRVRPNRPHAFDGERASGRAFLNSCRLYMAICSAEFHDDQTRINWVLSYMNLGRAAKFSARVMRHLTNTGMPMFTDYRSFQQYFVTNFCPIDEEMTAALTLNGDGYFQRGRSVDEYADEFTDLLDDAGLSDGLQVVLMFRKGLDEEIRTRMTEMVDGRPNDKRLAEWITVARRVEHNITANRTFASIVGTPTMTEPGVGNPPMCQRCGDTGHYLGDCKGARRRSPYERRL